MIHTFRIDRNKVLDLAETYSSYQAAKTSVDNYDHIRIKNADKDIIDKYFVEAGERFVQLLLNYMTEIQDRPFNDEYAVTCEFKNYPPCMIAQLEGKAYDIFAYYILSKWYSMLLGAETGQVMNGANHPAIIATNDLNDSIEKFKHLLIVRKRHVHVSSHPF